MKRPLVFGEKNPIDSESKWDHEKNEGHKKKQRLERQRFQWRQAHD